MYENCVMLFMSYINFKIRELSKKISYIGTIRCNLIIKKKLSLIGFEAI